MLNGIWMNLFHKSSSAHPCICLTERAGEPTFQVGMIKPRKLGEATGRQPLKSWFVVDHRSLREYSKFVIVCGWSWMVSESQALKKIPILGEIQYE